MLPPPHGVLDKGTASMAKQPLTFLGLVLILAGVLALAYQGISYTKREKVLDFGPLKASVDTRETLPIPPWVGGLAVGGGVLLLVMGIRKKG
jgi:hypothetical protein